jgi:hypothetical protein
MKFQGHLYKEHKPHILQPIYSLASTSYRYSIIPPFAEKGPRPPSA